MSAKILIIEDDYDTRELIVALFKVRGYVPVVAFNGEDGLRRARDDKPDLILCDIQMPLMDGFEAIRRLRTISTTRQLPILALTSSVQPGDREKGIAAGFTDYFAKPIDPATFVAQVEKFLAPGQRASANVVSQS